MPGSPPATFTPYFSASTCPMEPDDTSTHLRTSRYGEPNVLRTFANFTALCTKTALVEEDEEEEEEEEEEIEEEDEEEEEDKEVEEDEEEDATEECPADKEVAGET